MSWIYFQTGVKFTPEHGEELTSVSDSLVQFVDMGSVLLRDNLLGDAQGRRPPPPPPSLALNLSQLERLEPIPESEPASEIALFYAERLPGCLQWEGG